MHDDVLACLLLAARGTPGLDAPVAEQAAVAAERIRTLELMVEGRPLPWLVATGACAALVRVVG